MEILMKSSTNYFAMNTTLYLVVPVVLFLNEMITSSESDQVCVVRWRRYWHTAGTAHIRVTQLIGQHLNLIRTEVIVVPQHMVVWWTTCSLQVSNKLK